MLTQEHLEPVINKYAASHPATLNIKKAALLVIDMQEYFREMAKPVMQTVSFCIDQARRQAIPIYWTRHGHNPSDKDGNMLTTFFDADELIYRNTTAWNIMPELVPGIDESIIDKRHYSAFFRTDLDRILKSLGIEDVIITGVMTNCCCDTTAREAFMLGYRVFFIADATATENATLHLASLETLGFGFAYLKFHDLLAQTT